ncbi:MAG: prolyl oligopeptidase family serine peptidase [Colwellia sp.]
MKINLIAVALGLSLVACTTTPQNESASSVNSSNQTDKTVESAILQGSEKSLTLDKEQLSQSNKEIKLTKIMSDPDWFGRSPHSWYWGDSSNQFYYQQKQSGSRVNDLFTQSISGEANASKVALADLHKAADRRGVFNSAGDKKVYIFKGNLFLKTFHKSQDKGEVSVKQLTFTSNAKNSEMFLSNGDIAYRSGNTFYRYEIKTGHNIELVKLNLTPEPKGVTEPSTYLAKEQHKLIDYIALQHKNRQDAQAKSEQLLEENATVVNQNVYFGKGKTIRHASLSPNADKLIVSLAEDKPSRSATDIMPNYVSKDGVIESVKVRARVADNRKYSEELYLVDLTTGTKSVLSYDALPDFDKDVLASVKKENYKRQGKDYVSKKKPRNIHLLAMYKPVKWSNDGSQVAIMLEAWDNKDRWLTTVDFDKSTLNTQHQLHDDAWINWNFNAFGWLNNNGENQLFYLSEESGYGHLYTKPLNGKAVQLTKGNFEVSDVTLMKDNKNFVFKANKKHPGIYEIYQISLDKTLTALTNLGGMNDYALSPDESSLLIEHSTVTMPPELYVVDMPSSTTDKAKQAKRLTYTVSEEFLSLPWAAPTIVAIPSSNQDDPIYSRVYFPENYDIKADKNKAVMFTHGAGYLQNAHMGWSGYFREFMFHSMLVQQGYVVIDMDYRASKGYGRDWRTSIYRHMGSVEVEDMRDGVNWIVENANVDKDRIGTYGGSYGGFLTLMSMFTAPDLFESGSAIRLVSDWAYYNHGYTSNILNTPEDDPIAYERSSPIYFAEGLEKPLLINAPMVDDNVFFEDTVRLVQRLIELEKQDFETAIYPVEPHGFVQPSSWLDEYRRIYKLFENTL